MNKWEIFERVGLVLMLLGFITLGWLGWRSQANIAELLRRTGVAEQRLDSLIKHPTGENRQSITGQNQCDQACIRQLVTEAVASISGVSIPAREEVVERVVEKVQTVTANSVKTQYVPLGSGETSSTSWTDASGAEVTFDIADFGTVKKVYFEIQLTSPTSGKVFARLWDKRAGSIVIGSEVSHGSGDAWLLSSTVTIPGGGRTIIVQLRSENGQLVKVLSSRLRIDI